MATKKRNENGQPGEPGGDEATATAAPAKAAKAAQYGVYQKRSGSYTARSLQFRPLTATAIPEQPAELVRAIEIAQTISDCPVRFFPSEATAKAEVEKLRALFAKTNPKV